VVDGTEPEDWRGWEEDPAWVSERWFDVFDAASGRFLGRVDVPEDFSPDPEPVIDGNRFIGLTVDEFDRPVVRRYRLEVPGRLGNGSGLPTAAPPEAR
jgi:hypothetical protein